MGEITVILLLALIFLGPKKLPEMASGLGRMIRQLRKITSDVKNEIVLDDAIRKPFEELRDAVTLHPDELRRRDEIKRALEETRMRLEAEAAAANAPPANPDETADSGIDPAAMAEGPSPDVPPPPIPRPPSSRRRWASRRFRRRRRRSARPRRLPARSRAGRRPPRCRRRRPAWGRASRRRPPAWTATVPTSRRCWPRRT